jgi:branched-chain amino acid transport system permease protein
MSQVLVNGIVASCTIALVALGFGLLYRIIRFFDFSYGIIYTLAAYTTFGLAHYLKAPLGLALVLGVAFASVLACSLELFIYRPLRGRNASASVMLLASLGVYIVLQNMISLCFGNDTKVLRSGSVNVGIGFCGARITEVQVALICATAILFIVLLALLNMTKIGKAMRAVAVDSDLAAISGVPVNGTILCTFVLASVLAGICAVLVSMDTDLTPLMGMRMFMYAAVAAIAGGIESPGGIAIGALLLGMAQHFGIWVIGSQWQDAIAFLILIGCLIIRPKRFVCRG